MKKLLILAITAVMVLSMIPVMAFTASAETAEGYPDPAEGFWSTWRTPGGYNLEEGESYTPAPGYKYTSEGFTTIPADYTNMTPFFTVQTSNPQDLKQGFYMQFRVDDFSYTGENGDKGEWICLSITDRRLISPGVTTFNNNWLALLRGSGNGSAGGQSWTTTKEEKDQGIAGTFDIHGTFDLTGIPMDEDREVYELEVTWNGSAYEIQINGVVIPGAAAYSKHIASFEECYVGVTFMSGEKNGTASCTILKQGTSKADAETPSGNDEKEPDPNILVYGDRVDASTVEENQPALLWDAHKSTFFGSPTGSNISLFPTGAYTYHVTANAASCEFAWHIKNPLTYHAEDFPVFAMMLKDFYGNDGYLYYCAGEVMNMSQNAMTAWTPFDDNSYIYGADDEYTYIIIDLTDLWEGRIHSMRPAFNVDPSDPDQTEWDIEYMAMFRSVEEAKTYGEAYLKPLVGDLPTDPVDPGDATDAPTEAPTAAPTDAPTAAPTDAPTAAPTDAPATEAPKADDGCASVLGMGTVAILAAATAAVALKKRHD